MAGSDQSALAQPHWCRAGAAPFVGAIPYNQPTMSDLTFRQSQKLVDRWVCEQGTDYWNPLAQLARLTEELGETARLVNHLYGEKPKRPDESEQDLGLELADLLYTIICLANSQGIDLQDSFERVLAKYRQRDAARYRPATSPASDPVNPQDRS